VSKRLSGKTALITGASRGIGYAIAHAYASEGANVVLNARDAERLAHAAQALQDEHKVMVQSYAGDVTDRDFVQLMVEQAWAASPIDILVNNAGVYKPLPFVDYAEQDFRDLFEVNVFGVIHVTQVVLRNMIARGGGNVVNIASTAGKWGSRNQSAYNMSKHAIVGMTRCVALEMAPHKIRVNAICPWIVDTDLADTFTGGHAEILGLSKETVETNLKNAIPLHQRWIRPEEVAGLAVYLGADESSYITGQAWTVDGGYTMI
jgi:NAD(P)-dependent dehydrogenase (short-subunit alcohol dehydrogenase family)